MDMPPPVAKYGLKPNHGVKLASFLLLPLMLLVRPGRFMGSWGIRAHLLWVFIAAWLIGSSGMINTVVNRTRSIPESLPIVIDSWTKVWLIVLGFGLLRGLLTYALGGLWIWLRLRICGVRGNEWGRSTRIFCFSMLVQEIPSLLALVYFTIRYDDLRGFIAQPVGMVNLIAGLFLLLSPIVAYVGVLACYRVRMIWAALLFLVVPMSWRVVVLAILSYNMVTSTGTVLLPDIQHPIAQSDGVFTFDLPADWIVLPPEELDEHTISQIEMKSDHAQASVLIRVLLRDGIDPNDHDLALIKKMGYTITNQTVHSDARIGVLYGYGVEYDLKKENKPYKMFHLVAGLDTDHGILIRSLSSKRYKGSSKHALQQIVDSLVISSVDEVAADIENTKEVSRDWFTHQAPGNWNEQVGSHKQYEFVEQHAFGESYIRFTIYDRPGGGGGKGVPEKELQAVLEYGMHKDRMISDRSMNSWLGFQGSGAKGTIWQPLTGVHDFRVLFVQLKDGRVLGIKKYQAQSSAELTDPGFKLVESSFKLLVDPAEREP
jgi:hypothetical protein